MATTTTAEPRPNRTYHDELAVIREELDKCMKCGNCMAVCPVYGAEKVEAAVTRSKIAVAQAVPPTDIEQHTVHPRPVTEEALA